MPEPIGEVQTKEEELRPPAEEGELDIREPEEVEDEFPAFEKAEKAADDKDAGGEEKGKEGEQKKGGEEEEGAFSAELLQAAEEVGFSIEEVKAFDSPEALQGAITAVEKRIADMGQEAMESKSGEEEKPSEKKKETETDKSADILVEISSDEDVLDSTVVGDLKSLAGAHNKLAPVVVQLASAVNYLLEKGKAAEDAQFDVEMGTAMKELGEDWRDVFGKKPYSEMSKQERDSHENLNKLQQQMLVIGAGRERAGLPELDTIRLFKKALPLAFPEKLKSGERKKLSEKLKDREKLMGGRPTHRKGKELKGEELAVANLIQRRKERGGAFEETDAEFPE